MLDDFFAPSADATTIKVGAEVKRECPTPEIATRLLDLTSNVDVVQLFPNLRVPTLVLHRQQDRA